MEFVKQKAFFVGIDSDGTAFDSMKIKHTFSFVPAAIEVFGLEACGEAFCEIEERINLYSLTRGINRFPGLLMTFEELIAAGYWAEDQLTGLEDLKAYIESGYPLSNAGLKDWLAENPSAFGQKVLRWSELGDIYFEKLTKDIEPYDGVARAIEHMRSDADIMVVSAASSKGLEKDWGRAGLAGKVNFIAGQEFGKKAEQLLYAKEKGFAGEQMLMVGDAPGDYEAAKKAGVWFYPMIPGRETECWEKLSDKYFDLFVNGQYDKDVEAALYDEFIGFLEGRKDKSVAQAAEREENMITDILKNMTVEEKVGQMCVPILQSDKITDEIRKAVTEYKVGVVRYCPDAEFDNASVAVGEPNKYFTPQESAEFLNELQSLTEIPLIISVDQEGGCRSDVNRCNAMVYASHMCFGVADDAELTYQVAKATAQEFRAMGINQIQSPICDVFRYPGRQTMKAATFGEDAENVAKHVVAMKRGFQDGGVLSMGKHFPGYGSIATDAHKGTAHIVKTVEELEKEDIVPFKHLVDDGVDGIMMGHVIVDAIDPQYPATLSKTLTTGYVREKLGFKGIIMTDAMRMKAIQDNYGTGAASVMAIKAGCDLVLLRGDFDHFKDGYEAILEAAKSGEISEEILDASVLRILKAKESIGLFENKYAACEKANAVVGTAEHQELLFKLASRSISVLREKNLPLSADDGKKISVVSVEPQKIAAAMDEKQCVDMLEKEIRAIHANTDGIVVKLDPDEEDIQKAVALSEDADIIVLGMCSGIIFRKQVNLYNALKALGKTMIVVAMESPCDIELVPDCDNYIATYGAARDWMKVAAMRIFGLTDINAKPAITIPDLTVE